MSFNLAPHYDAGEEMEVDLGGKPTTSASSDQPAPSHRAGAIPRGERCGRCFRNKCVRCVFIACMRAASGFGKGSSAPSNRYLGAFEEGALRFNYDVLPGGQGGNSVAGWIWQEAGSVDVAKNGHQLTCGFEEQFTGVVSFVGRGQLVLSTAVDRVWGGK